MNTKDKIKRTLLIALGFGLATYLLINGFAILEKEKELSAEQNATSKIHSNAVQ
jgi:hypothetical protein